MSGGISAKPRITAIAAAATAAGKIVKGNESPPEIIPVPSPSPKMLRAPR